ncbi:hypothetical protein CYMTET_29225, partial [Cymbomonas tetramitiformis]
PAHSSGLGVALRLQVTEFQLMITIFAAVLGRHCGQQDVAVATIHANRLNVAVERLVGCFVTPLPLRVTWGKKGDSVRRVVQRLQRLQEDAVQQMLPFATLLQALSVSSRDRPPLVQVCAVLQSYDPTSALQLPGLACEPIDYSLDNGMFEVLLEIFPLAEGGHRLLWHYNTNLFAPESVRRWSERFNTMLQAAARDLQADLACLPVCTEEESAQMLRAWCMSSKCVHPAKPATVHELIAAQALALPRAPAVIHQSDQLTYMELEQKSSVLAAHLIALGIEAESRVGLFMPRSVLYVVGLLAAMKAGGAYVPVDTAYPLDRVQFILEDSECMVLLTNVELSGTLRAPGLQHVCLDQFNFGAVEDHRQMKHAVAALAKVKCEPSQLAYMIYTSGTTGKPKGVGIEHSGVLNTIHAMMCKPGDVALQFFGVAFDGCVLEVFRALCGGATLVLRTDHVYEDIMRHKVTHIGITPSALAALNPVEMNMVRHIAVGGEACSMDLVRKWAANRTFLNMYGPTEISIVATTIELTTDTTIVSIGRPLPNVFCVVLDAQQQLLPPGVLGELYIGGAGVARGYHKRPELTAEKFIRNPFGEGRLYASGDLVRWLPNGELEFKGRIGTQVKLRGYRIELGEIEQTLASFNGVAGAVVLLQPDKAGFQRLVAWVHAVDADLEEAALLDFAATMLPKYMLPSELVLMDVFPLTPNGKIDLKALPEPVSRKLQTIQPPEGYTQTALAEIWKEILGVRLVSQSDDFFALGGNSITLAQLHQRLRTQFEVKVELSQLYTRLELAQMANLLENATGEDAVDWARECTLPADLRAEGMFSSQLGHQGRPLQGVFLTGATGYVGAYLLRALLAAHKVIVVLSDLEQPQLGMSAEDWEEVAAGADAVVHNGAVVNFNMPYSAMRPANVAATLDILRLTAATTPKILYHISTLSTFANATPGSVIGSHCMPTLTGLVGGYPQSKAVGEHLVRAAAERGCAAVIVRLGRILGDGARAAFEKEKPSQGSPHSSPVKARSAASQVPLAEMPSRGNKNDFMVRFVQGCIQAGYLPDNYISDGILPVDCAAAFLVQHVASATSQDGRTALPPAIHLNHPQPLPAHDFLQFMTYRSGYHLRMVPTERFFELLAQTGTANALFPLIDTMRARFGAASAAAETDAQRSTPNPSTSSSAHPALQKSGLSIEVDAVSQETLFVSNIDPSEVPPCMETLNRLLIWMRQEGMVPALPSRALFAGAGGRSKSMRLRPSRSGRMHSAVEERRAATSALGRSLSSSLSSGGMLCSTSMQAAPLCTPTPSDSLRMGQSLDPRAALLRGQSFGEFPSSLNSSVGSAGVHLTRPVTQGNGTPASNGSRETPTPSYDAHFTIRSLNDDGEKMASPGSSGDNSFLGRVDSSIARTPTSGGMLVGTPVEAGSWVSTSNLLAMDTETSRRVSRDFMRESFRSRTSSFSSRLSTGDK